MRGSKHGDNETSRTRSVSVRVCSSHPPSRQHIQSWAPTGSGPSGAATTAIPSFELGLKVPLRLSLHASFSLNRQQKTPLLFFSTGQPSWVSSCLYTPSMPGTRPSISTATTCAPQPSVRFAAIR